MARRNRLVIGISLLVLAPWNSAAQEARKHAVVVPADVLLPVVVSQPTCPLKIENVRLVRYFSPRDYEVGGPGALYTLRNAGKKPIVAYTIATWYSNNSGSVLDWRANQSEHPLLRGGLKGPTKDFVTVPLTDELRNKLDLRSPMRMIRLFMLIQVTFADGTKYDATETFAALREHLDAFETVYEKRISRNRRHAH